LWQAATFVGSPRAIGVSAAAMATAKVAAHERAEATAGALALSLGAHSETAAVQGLDVGISRRTTAPPCAASPPRVMAP
jgi:hypothetical protein